MVDLSRVAVTVTPPIAPSSAERTSPVRADAFSAQDMLWKVMAEIEANRTTAKCFMRMAFSPVRNSADGDIVATWRPNGALIAEKRKRRDSHGQASALW